MWTTQKNISFENIWIRIIDDQETTAFNVTDCVKTFDVTTISFKFVFPTFNFAFI